MTASPARAVEEDKPKKQRPKMTLGEQSEFLFGLLSACRMLGKDYRGQMAGVAVLTLTEDDILRLETVWQSLLFFELHRADQMVRDKIVREARGRRK